MASESSESSPVLCSPWATSGDLSASVLETLTEEDVTLEQVDAYLLEASEVLWALSGRKWYGGGCEEVATLRSHPSSPGQGTWPYHQSWMSCACWGSGRWLDGRLFPAHGGAHTVAGVTAIRLPRSPVTEVVSVAIDAVPFAAWRLLRTGWLERTDGRSWRLCDDSTEITYRFGEPPPLGGVNAAAEFGVEIAKGRHGIKGCRLPRRTTNVTRQGVSLTMADPSEFLDKGLVGLSGVDTWLRAVNPHGNPQSAGVWSPDLPSTMRSAP